ncbi:MAG TPA: alpha/beta hydrolase [Rhizomicrobium sp.]|jgi:pimeloyl-ACP methyl ester carboxylesterase|nr:alpha/beta hydrolase [Rhizomicrobium sp.]
MRKIFILGVVLFAIGAACYFLFTPDIPRAALVAKYGQPPSQFMTLADGSRIHFRDRGPSGAPALILIHGSNASLLTWEPWARRLSDSFRVISIDMPGHGLTGAVPSADYSEEAMSEVVARVADKLKLTRFAIGGNSMGGGVAARFAEKYPQRVTQLILVDAGGMPVREGKHLPLVFRLARIPVLNLILLYATPRALVVEGLDDAIVRKAIIDDRMVDTYWDFARMQGTRAATLRRFQEPRDDFIAQNTSRIAAPTLILWGEEDRLVPLEAGRLYARAIRGSRLIIYPATGHVPQEEVPDKSASDVRNFLLATSRS